MVIQIIVAIYSIITASDIVQAQIDELQQISNILPDMQQNLEMFAMTTKQVITMSVINIILNIVAGIIVLKNKTVERKGSLIAIYIICSLTTPNTLVSWITAINVIVLSCIKREKKKLNMKEAEETLKLEQSRTSKKQMVLIIVFVGVYLLQLIPASVLPDSKVFLIAFTIFDHLLPLVLAMIAFWKDIKEGVKVIKENYKTYIKYTLRVLGIMLLFYFIANVVTIFTTNKATSVNQETLEMLPIIFVAPMAIIWAPIVEESLYRGVIRKLIKNDILYIILSSFIFGLMHTIGEASLELAIATSVPYAIIGGAFAYIYAKTNNLACNIIAHCAYNTLGVLLMFLL